jgi:hypothetical protein
MLLVTVEVNQRFQRWLAALTIGVAVSNLGNSKPFEMEALMETLTKVQPSIAIQSIPTNFA